MTFVIMNMIYVISLNILQYKKRQRALCTLPCIISSLAVCLRIKRFYKRKSLAYPSSLFKAVGYFPGALFIALLFQHL